VLIRDQDFICDDASGILRCQPKTVAATSAFKVLQLQLSKLLPQLPEAGEIEIDVNGVIGPSTALGVQILATRLAEGSHKELAQLAIGQPEDAIPRIAESALEIVGYVDDVMTKDPTAIAMPRPAQELTFDPLAMLRSIFTPKRIAAGVGALVGLGALVMAGTAAQRRVLGLLDRSSFLPPSDGSDEFDDDAHGSHDDQGGDEPDNAIDDGIDREGAIDVEAVERPAA
jgi:hypothetical protein